MFTEFTDFEVRITDAPYRTSGGLIWPGTVRIVYTDPEKEKTLEEYYGYAPAEMIYQMIREGRDINLSECFIEKFSLTEYRSLQKLEAKSYVKLGAFSARRSFFNCSSRIDFSFAEFSGDTVDFEATVFARGMVSFNSASFADCSLNMSYVLFRNGNIDFANCRFGKGQISFKNSKFHTGSKDFQYTSFGDGEVLFVNTDFGDGDVSFINSSFGQGTVSFKVARFGQGKVDFHYAKFGGGEISFERTEFGNGKVDFRMAEFNESRINFNRSSFGNGEVTFEGSELKGGKLLFRKASVGEGLFSFEQALYPEAEVFFDGTDFGKGTITFQKARIRHLSLRSCQMNDYVDLRMQEAALVDLSDTVIRDIIDLTPYDSPVAIGTLKISGMRLPGRIYIDWFANNLPSMILSQEQATEREISEQFRILKLNFNATGRFSYEDRAYVLFRRYEALADRKERIAKNPWSALWEYPVYVFKWLVFDKIGLYATAPGRVLVSVIAFWFGFGILFYLAELLHLGHTQSAVNNPDHLSMLSQSFYHSAITFFTIGYGDVYPQGLTRLLSALEGFTGVFMMSYFTVAFVRKILR